MTREDLYKLITSKKKPVYYKNKHLRTKFDTSIEDKKMETISKIIGLRSKEISEILNKKNNGC